MTWKNGRQLATLQDSDDNISYTYSSKNIRISKIVNGIKYTYAYLDGLLMYETRGESKFYYSYDIGGNLYSVKYTLTDSSNMQTYFFTHNSRGDIIGVYSDTGVLSAKYEYDAWGNILSITDSNGSAITDQNHIANLNPFRYRGYYYDSETGLYYLMSRYYDPVTHRFINADGYFQSGGSILDTNMSTYCRNNPIIFIDPFGLYVTVITIYGDANVFFGVYDSISFAIDDKGGMAVQRSYVDYNNNNAYIGFADAGVGVSVSFIWDAETVMDLEENQTLNIGASLGSGPSVGLDLISLDEYDVIHSENESGLSFSLGVGAGIDIHSYTTTTKTLWANNKANQKNETKTSHSTTVRNSPTTVKTCRTCGRPTFICNIHTHYQNFY